MNRFYLLFLLFTCISYIQAMEKERLNYGEIAMLFKKWQPTFDNGEEALEEKKITAAIILFKEPIGKSCSAVESYAYYNLGRAYFKNNDFVSAISCFEKAHAQAWNEKISGMSLIGLGQINEKQNFSEKAKKYYNKALLHEDSEVKFVARFHLDEFGKCVDSFGC